MDLAAFQDQLSQINWKKLHHAYGSAQDLPALLMSVARGKDDGIDLFSNIYHQGTVYSATAPAVPFLAELAVAFAERADATRACEATTLLMLLGDVAAGMGYYQVHGQLSWMEKGATPRVLAREMREVTQAHLAVCQAWPRLAGLLAHPDQEVRMEVIVLAGRLYGLAATVWERLQTLLVTLSDPLCRCGVWWSLHLLLQRARAMDVYTDWRAWPHPLPTDQIAPLQQSLADQLQVLAADPQAAAPERWVAVELLHGERPAALDATTLAALHAPATALLESHRLWAEGYPWLEADPALRLDVLKIRLRAPQLSVEAAAGGAWELQTVAQAHRLLRERAVAGLVDLLTHASPDTRLAAARHLYHCGLACRAHTQALWQAGAAHAELRTWLLAPLRACGKNAQTADWLMEELLASEQAWSMIDSDQEWPRPEQESRLLRAVDQVRASDAEGALPLLRQGLQTWMDQRAPLTARHGEGRAVINLPVRVLCVLDALEALPHALLSQALQHGLPAALTALARRARLGGPREQAAVAAQVRSHAGDERFYVGLRRKVQLEMGDDMAREASLAGLRKGTVHNTDWDEARWWAQQPDGVPQDLLGHWRGFLTQTDSAGAIMATECLWRNTPFMAELLDVLLVSDPRIHPFTRLDILRDMAPVLNTAERARVLAMYRQWLEQPSALANLRPDEDERWLQTLRQAVDDIEEQVMPGA